MSASELSAPASVKWPFQTTTSWRTLPTPFWSDCSPAGAAAPELVVFNTPLCEALNLPLADMPRDVLARWLSGSDLPDTCQPLAQAYAGHQFGGFTMLGDGRAHLLAEFEGPDGIRRDLQLKGSGRTPYSRGGDGRAALGPMLREFVISEAMAALGIPTSRSLAVLRTGETLWRDGPLPGAVLTRIAASHLRVGTFEYAAALRDRSALEALLTYAVQRHDPDLADVPEPGARVLAWLNRVAERQIDLILHWLRVGFIHGVMNTDNTFISGETLDYGPCAFLDEFVPNKVFSSIDRHGRYGFENQKRIILWNLARLAEAVLPLLDEDPKDALDRARTALKNWDTRLNARWLSMMRGKLGLDTERPEDESLIKDLLAWMHRYEADYTLTFRALADDAAERLPEARHPKVQDWIRRWRARLAEEGPVTAARFEAMQAVNPARIPRNHQVEAALTSAEAGHMAPLRTLLAALAEPYRDDPAYTAFAQPPTPDERVVRTFCGT
ncbi:MAG: YdiU family protein [Gammaproteobacteria bacterium]|nr:MAG: YdiU family protein [Gammaproteobacteria bacterium]